MWLSLLALAAPLALLAADDNPILHWIVNPAAAATANPALRAILPDVQSVRVEGGKIVVESAGLSLQSMAPLQANDRDLSPGVRKFTFRFPLVPKAAARASRTPVGIAGVFLNGVPFYSPVSSISYRDQDLWHRDPVWLAQQANGQSPLVTSLIAPTGEHSPLIGFALDGYPVYGPYGIDDKGRLRRFRSSYRLRAITKRTTLPDGAELTPSQEGPPVGLDFPLGTFVEDYEYLTGSGDLDEANGRFARTPEYPNGTYAYFLSTDDRGRLMYPYLMGAVYHGEVDQPREPDATTTRHDGRVDLTTPSHIEAGQPVALDFVFHDTQGRRIRFLEKVHEQPVHLLVVSQDLTEFAHIHPILQPDDSFRVTHSFPSGGTYWLYADHTPPGGVQTIARFHLTISGTSRPTEMLCPDELTKSIGGLRVKLTFSQPVRAGRDLDLRFDVADAMTGQPATDLDPYLGAWAHIMILSQDGANFIHAHPLDAASPAVESNPWQHTHAAPGPSPSSVSTITGFRSPGLYRLWVQFQRQGKVITVPFTFAVAAFDAASRVTAIPADAIRIHVSASGFEPARIAAAVGQTVKLAFQREDAQNCVNAVVFPELGLRRPLAPGETTLVEIPTATAREYHFACGMNMYRGSLVIH